MVDIARPESVVRKKKLKRLDQGEPGADELHGARKALKAWLGALAHLGETPPSAMTALADLLGDINNMFHVASRLVLIHAPV